MSQNLEPGYLGRHMASQEYADNFIGIIILALNLKTGVRRTVRRD
jgi:hypothetical protein